MGCVRGQVGGEVCDSQGVDGAARLSKGVARFRVKGFVGRQSQVG